MAISAVATGAIASAAASSTIDVTVNGRSYRLTVADNETLLDLLRETLRLTGAKFGCGNGECGACTVIKNGQVVSSCLVLAVECDGSDILTIEGLARPNGELHPLQDAFVENFAIQCGFCTPGMIMCAAALLAKNPDPSEEDVRRAINGNLCRCTGYVNIVKAVKAAAATMTEAPRGD